MQFAVKRIRFIWAILAVITLKKVRFSNQSNNFLPIGVRARYTFDYKLNIISFDLLYSFYMNIASLVAIGTRSRVPCVHDNL